MFLKILKVVVRVLLDCSDSVLSQIYSIKSTENIAAWFLDQILMLLVVCMSLRRISEDNTLTDKVVAYFCCLHSSQIFSSTH